MHINNKPTFNLKIIRSPWSDFSEKEIENSLKSYPDYYLKEIAEQGFNGIWVHAILRDIVSSRPFPEFGKKENIQIPALNKLVEKTSRFGIKVFLYLCEPRGFRENDNFWKLHPEVKGQPVTFKGAGTVDGKYYALCSSTKRVKEYLQESSYNLFKKVPGLGGVFMITASEFHTHCYSHFPKSQKQFTDPNMEEWAKSDFLCERCKKREPYKVVTEIINLVNSGIKSASPDAYVIAWSWSWKVIEQDYQKNLINLLPSDVIFMSDWEKGGHKLISKKRFPVDEYSFSYTGPSPKFKKRFYIAKKRKLKVMAKIQIGTTHEFVTVPYLPLPHILAEKIERMKKFGVDGYLGCWIFGGDISPMSKLAGKMFSTTANISKSEAVKELAIDEFGEKVSCDVVKAWKCFSEAWKNYPFSIPFLYYGPINYAAAYPLSTNLEKRPKTPSWMPLPRDKKGHIDVGDNLEEWVSPFTPEIIVETFKKLLKQWDPGISILKKTLKDNKENNRLQKELDLAEHIFLSVKSTINIIMFYKMLRKFKKNKTSKKLNKEIRTLFKDEIEIAEKDKKIIKRNKNFGFHPEAHTYFVTQKDLDYKISLLKSEINHLRDF